MNLINQFTKEGIPHLSQDMVFHLKLQELSQEERGKLLFWNRRLGGSLDQSVFDFYRTVKQTTNQFLMEKSKISLGIADTRDYIQDMRNIVKIRKNALNFFHPSIAKEIKRGRGYVQEGNEVYEWYAIYGRQKF